MDLPKPPEDQELRNIIDKLAQFVARNGHEFEQMTKQKQRDNPRFYFLFGGEYFNYYQYRVTSEQAILRKNKEMHLQQQQPNQTPMVGVQMQQHQMQPPIWQNNNINNINNIHVAGSSLPLQNQPNLIQQQINEIQEQIMQSEANLAAQHQVIMQQQQVIIDDTIRQAQDESLRRMAEDFSVNLHEFESILQPICDSCTKDSIANGKTWIFNNCNAPVHYDIVCRFLLKRIEMKGIPFDAKLHLMYLINDLSNHCMRKGDDNLKRALNKFIVPIFCSTFVETDEDQQQKLNKLLKLWEVNNYFDQVILDQLKNPHLALANYKTALCNEFSGQIQSITACQMAKYNQLQKQHNDFVAHQQNKIHQLQQQMVVVPISLPTSMPQQMMMNQPPPQLQPPMQQPMQAMQRQAYEQPSQMFLPIAPQQAPITSQSSQAMLLPQHSMVSTAHLVPVSQTFPVSSSVPPVSVASGPFPGPHLGPGNAPFFNTVPNQPPPHKEVPYYELPAGLMAPLVNLEDCDYKAINPKDIRLPPPAPPNERLLQAVEMFYSPPTHERPRNSDGWEQLGLYEFFKAKAQHRKTNEGHSTSPDQDSSDSLRYNTQSGSDFTSKRHYNEQFHSHSKNRSPSPSSKRRYREDKSPQKQRNKRSRSRSPYSSSRRRFSRSRSRSRSRSHSPEPSFRSRSRSPSPPHHFASFRKSDEKIDETNKGHQMLKKMGWSGSSGLGLSEQGIHDPIKGGDVRTKQDLYKGVGVEMNDPFENFRKNKGQAFMQRILDGRTRDNK